MKLNYSLCLIILFAINSLSAQKTLQATRVNEQMVIDGKLDEGSWATSDIASEFITLRPEFGLQQKEATKVRVLYDDNALYISAEMDEVSRDSIMTELTQRDDIGNTDFFGIMIDTYGNGADGVDFIVGATGVQFDAVLPNNGNEDTSWDAVWFSDVCLSDDGWVCEMKIPYSALRFPKNDVQEWTINFTRKQAKNNVQAFWNPIDPTENGFFNQSGKLQNIKDIEPPVRLSFSPYFSVYANHHHDASLAEPNSVGHSYNGGMDVKYGINDAFTLDMTLIPDFGQVESDDQVVNLSPFEIRFDEKRPFFTEGLELFQKGNIFYSRRVGGLPVKYYDVEDGLAENEEVLSNQRIPQLYNATKISGRMKGGLGIGVFNAVEGGAEAIISNTETGDERIVKTQGLTNYNVLVFDQSLKNNSQISLTNTNVWRKGSEFYDANVTAVEFDIKDNKQQFRAEGAMKYSVQSFDDAENNTGHAMFLELAKISGNWNYWTFYGEESPNYNPNDLGFLRAANERNVGIGASYSLYETWGPFNRANVWTNMRYNRIVEPDEFTGWWFNLGFWAQSKNFWQFNMWTNYSPERYDFFEPRVEGRYVTNPELYNLGFWIGSDDRKKLRVSGSIFGYQLSEEGRNGYEMNIRPRYRISDRFTVSLSTSLEKQFKDTGWVEEGDNGEIYFGKRRRTTIQNRANLFYNFTEKIGLNFRLRHYWFKAKYDSFHELGLEGDLMDSDFSGVPDFAFNAFNIDFNFNWRFAPGSDIFFNWKNSISGSNDSDGMDVNALGYGDGIKQLSDFPQDNSFSIRVVYYLDYLSLKNKF